MKNLCVTGCLAPVIRLLRVLDKIDYVVKATTKTKIINLKKLDTLYTSDEKGVNHAKRNIT